MSTQWYLSYDGQQTGPMDLAQARAQAAANPNGHAWRDGLPNWIPIADIAEFNAPQTASSPPPRPVAGGMRSDEV